MLRLAGWADVHFAPAPAVISQRRIWSHFSMGWATRLESIWISCSRPPSLPIVSHLDLTKHTCSELAVRRLLAERKSAFKHRLLYENCRSARCMRSGCFVLLATVRIPREAGDYVWVASRTCTRISRRMGTREYLTASTFGQQLHLGSVHRWIGIAPAD